MIVVTMLEHIEAVHNLEEILATPGLTAILIGAWDLSASMGHRASLAIQKWCRPSEAIITKTRQTDVFTGIAIGHDPGPNIEWAKKGAQWLGLGADWAILIAAAGKAIRGVRRIYREANSKENML